ncbi:MAG: helix-turn-helix transcriptional regulator [Ilumatobacteraceae bacterium]|nr:helix-turn-helix transcriptional regulator [Ilumatobacteraceae bacterium]
MSEGADLVTSIGSQVRVRRRQQGVTLQELAERADLSQSFLSKVERGMAQLSIGALNRVAQALGTSALGLFGGMNPDRRVEVV